jgi:tape measure protein
MAIQNVGSIEYDSRINTGRLKSDAKDAESIVSNTSKNIGNNLDNSESHASNILGNIMGKVRAAAFATASAIGAAGIASATFGIKSAADFEQTRIGLENMLGSADKARSLLSDISDFAAETPFEFPELAQATRQLVAFGFTGEDAFKTMKQLGDVSAAVGAPINDLAYLMGTLRTQGRAFTVDIRQFAQRGVPIYEYLAKVLGKSETAISEMIETGKIGFPEVEKAFVAMTGEGGKFYKTMDKQSESLSGQFSTLKDNLGQTLRELVGISKTGDVVKGSLFDKIRTGIGQVNDDLPALSTNFQKTITSFLPTLKQWAVNTAEVGKQIAQYLGPKLVAVGITLRDDVLPAVVKFVKAFGPAAGVGLVAILGLAVDALNGLLFVLTPVINFLSENTPVVWAMVAAFVAIKTALLIDAAVSTFKTGLAAAMAAIELTTAKANTSAGAVGGLRAALTLLSSPWVISLSIAGVAAVVFAIEEVYKSIQKIDKGIDDLSKKKVKVGNTGIEAGGTSDLGLVAQLRNMFGGFRAAGGPVSAGKSYIVGENQPEVFVPSTSGTILPDTDMLSSRSNSNVTVNVNMSGIMARSKSDERDIAKSLIKRINEELSAKNKPLIGLGAI